MAKVRFGLYGNAFAHDKEMQAKGLVGKALVDAALRCLLKNENPNIDWLLKSELNIALVSIYEPVAKLCQKFRKELDVRET